MINKLFLLFSVSISVLSCRLTADAPVISTEVRWYTNYEEAVKASRTDSKPLLLFFTGSDWCGWCTKLEDETFDSAEFAEGAGNKFILVKLDYPLYVTQELLLKEQNRQLQLKFDVRSFPTVILLDPQQNQLIGTVSYRPGGGKAFSDHINRLVNDFAAYKQNVASLDSKKFPGNHLKNLYEKSKTLHRINDTNAIVKYGMESEESIFFLIERYRYLADEGQLHSKEAVAIRQKLLMADPNNEHLAHYQVALIEFQAYNLELDGKNASAESTAAPLIAYIDKFGEQDKNNTWRLKIIISQVYMDKDQMSNALKYAQESYDVAPACVQAELSRAIKNIRARIHS